MAEASLSKRLVVALSTLRAAGNKSLLPGLKGTRTCSCCHRRWASEISDLNIADAKGVGVAAKLLLQKADQSAEELALLQEAAFLADLRHRSIVSLFGLRARRLAFVAGEESSQQVAADRSATALVGRDSEWSGVRALQEGAVHRDLRAQNVLVQAMDVEGKELAAKVADFGLAMPVNVSQRAKADEQLPLGGVHRSCGVLLWEVFTHCVDVRPYGQVTDVVEVYTRLQHADCPTAVTALVNRCWQWEANARPTMAKIAEQLQGAQSVAPSTRPIPTTPLPSVRRLHRRRRQLLASASPRLFSRRRRRSMPTR
jgi:hypothetical protein